MMTFIRERVSAEMQAEGLYLGATRSSSEVREATHFPKNVCVCRKKRLIEDLRMQYLR